MNAPTPLSTRAINGDELLLLASLLDDLEAVLDGPDRWGLGSLLADFSVRVIEIRRRVLAAMPERTEHVRTWILMPDGQIVPDEE